VGRPLATVTEGVNEARRRLIWALGLLAAVMVAAGWWIASRLTGSLERLAEYVLAIRDGRAATRPASRATEVASLGRAFEEMRVALEGKAYVEQYTQALAHELKAPLSAIRGAAELLAENPPEADRARFVANLRAESERLQQLVERLLELASLETRRPGAAMTEVDLSDILRDVQAATQELAVTRGVTLVFPGDARVPVLGEKFLLAQAVGNLVRNALEFTPPGGSVTVALDIEHTNARVTVADTGAGVPDYALDRIFERFYSLPRPDTGRKSSGLGLSIVREVARLHGGSVTLDNRPEGGARASLTLPLVRSS
jgi:two-component system sensor histidine kinase CreC